ncbi:hypothetical protein [Streptomyces sp. CC224B]|uniref:hypothetical protein n=1 Tax=Streptomyces sp. CC224B TaxID=3044571 RepID=UPI0024A7A59C|nr:hypothetical protein [Streptomyces sp. CC224B]
MTKDDGNTSGEQRQKDAAAASRRAREEEERAHSQPFDYPGPERRTGVRATRKISREQADADSVPGVPGGYGTTGGGQPGGSAGINPDSEGTLDPAEYADTIGGEGPVSGAQDEDDEGLGGGDGKA